MDRSGTTRERPWRTTHGLLAALVGFVLVLAGVVVGVAPAAAGNAVGASTPVKINTVGPSADIAAGQRLGKTVPQLRIVVATGVAAESASVGNRISITASDGQSISGFTTHGILRVVGDGGSRAGVTPRALLDALKNPTKITEGVDSLGRPFKIYVGKDARVVMNPETGDVVSVNPRSGAGANR